MRSSVGDGMRHGQASHFRSSLGEARPSPSGRPLVPFLPVRLCTRTQFLQLQGGGYIRGLASTLPLETWTGKLATRASGVADYRSLEGLEAYQKEEMPFQIPANGRPQRGCAPWSTFYAGTVQCLMRAV